MELVGQTQKTILKMTILETWTSTETQRGALTKDINLPQAWDST